MASFWTCSGFIGNLKKKSWVSILFEFITNSPQLLVLLYLLSLLSPLQALGDLWGPKDLGDLLSQHLPVDQDVKIKLLLRFKFIWYFPNFPKRSHKNKLSRTDYGEEYKCKEMIFTCVPAFPASPRTPLGPEIPWRTDISDKSAILLTSKEFQSKVKKYVTCYAHIK